MQQVFSCSSAPVSGGVGRNILSYLEQSDWRYTATVSTGQTVPAETETPHVAETVTNTGEAVVSHAQNKPRHRRIAKAEQPASKEPALSPEQAEVARLLAAAEADLKARRLTSPVGNNAWENYHAGNGVRASAHLEAMARGWSR